MEIAYANTVQDLVDFQMYHYSHDRRFRWMQALVMLIPAVFIIVFLVLQNLGGASLVGILVGVAAVVLVALVMRRFLQQRLRAAAVRAYTQGQGARTQGTHRLRITPEGIVETTTDGTYTTPWSPAMRVVETENAIYIYTAPASGLVIPLAHVKSGDPRAFVAEVRKRASAA